jgi:hypothetical protein
MINKEVIFPKIEELEGVPEANLIFRNGNIYFDHLNLSWLGNDILRSYGVTVSLANKFNSFYGRIGNEAKAALKKPVGLTNNEIKILFRVSVRISIQEVSEHIGIDVFKKLPDLVQVVLVSLWRQFGRLTRPEFPALAMTSRMLIRKHTKFAIRYLKDEKGWPVDNKEFMSRRLKEAGMLEVLIKDGK